MNIHSFLDKDTETFTHVLIDQANSVCAIIDPVLDFDPKAGKTSYDNVDKVIEFVKKQNLTLDISSRRMHTPTICPPHPISNNNWVAKS